MCLSLLAGWTFVFYPGSTGGDDKTSTEWSFDLFDISCQDLMYVCVWE